MTSEYDCPEMMELLVDYLEGELDDQKKAELEAHLELCPPCLNFLETYRETSEICRKALRREMPDALKSNLLSFLRRECGEES